jgi:hypothetical protein
MLVIIISIDCPIPPFPNFPRIMIELWRSNPANHPVHSHTQAQGRVTSEVWSCDWTYAATPFYILLSDIFRGPPPASYGNNDRVYLDAQAWREAIISRY